jgi:eukaryotic-like serine/threonine-protein kinase
MSSDEKKSPPNRADPNAGAGSTFDLTTPRGPLSYAPPVFQKGTVIGDHYRVIEIIGAGGMGQVLRARDEMLDRDVAVKVLKPATPLTDRVRRRFLTEAKAMARVRHENVVSVYAVGEIGDAPYMVMEFVEGCDLEVWLDARPEPAVDEAFEILRQLSNGVQAIHDAHTIHRDIKPSNVMLGVGFRVAVGDLGLARFAGGPQSAGSLKGLIGTPTFMSPEAIMGTIDPELAPRTDIYSLGVMGFHLLTGKPPFSGNNIADIMTKHMAHAPPKPSELRPTLTRAYDEPILAALAKAATDRPASVADWFKMLSSARERMVVAELATVLVADDDEDFRSFVRTVLEATIDGVQVTCVSNGARALDALDRASYSLLLLDLEMPEANGLEVMATLRARPVDQRPVVVVISATGTAADWSLLSRLGADSFLVKPVGPEQLARTVRRLLGPGSLPPE